VISSLLAAFTFLTRIPLPGAARVDADLLARSAVWFPLVGAAVGGIGALMLVGAARVWPAPIAAALSLLATVLVTGAFHEDALADTADGLGGGQTRERMLEIMRDSRVGSYGAVALVISLALRMGCLTMLVAPEAAPALIGAHVLARWSSLPLIGFLPYVRAQGAAKPFVGGVTPVRVLTGTVLAALLTAVALGSDALVAGVAAGIVTALAGVFFRNRLGGITGDCLGAANQTVELTVYLAVLA
jgi:adenosylcobinamide-GDP ribazoletransferase